MSNKSILKQGLVALTVATFLTTAFVVKAADSDSNPPGPAGGTGTNWENPAGPAGGPGASPDRDWNGWFAKHPGYKAKADRNHDGTIDEKERKWARRHWRRDNPPGPAGGPGAGPGYRHDKDNNPPGPKGGKGTNWENPPGAKGGKGTSPDRHGGGRRRR